MSQRRFHAREHGHVQHRGQGQGKEHSHALSPRDTVLVNHGADAYKAPTRASCPQGGPFGNVAPFVRLPRLAAAPAGGAHLHHLPVMNDDQQLVGVISTMDITAAVVNAIDEMDGAFLKRQLLEGAG